MKFPSCRHARPGSDHPGFAARPAVARWLAAEPFRLFFVIGALWSVVGVLLWPLYHAGKLTVYPNLIHARLMIEAFGGAFVVGFLGTAGPRMATAPKLTPVELAMLLLLHLANGFSLLRGGIRAGDALFLALLLLLLVGLGVRILRFRREAPPPQMLLALTGLGCGIAAMMLRLWPGAVGSLAAHRLADLLLYQGFLLPPVLGIGSFIFPRILGRDFGLAESARAIRLQLIRAAAAAVLVVGSFFIEAWGWPLAGCSLRTAAAAGYLLAEVRWRRRAEDAPRGSLAAGLHWALGLGLSGLVLAGAFPLRHIAVEHLLFVGGFGLLILVVASRVLFGHSGDLPGFGRRSWFVRGLIFLALLAAATRATADFFPAIMISHHRYAAWTWVVAVLLWLGWHRRRFFRREEE